MKHPFARSPGRSSSSFATAAGALLMGVSCLVSCGKAVTPEPGFSALLVTVEAKAKTGVKPAKVTAVAGGYGEMEGDETGQAFERVNYRSIDGVVVWVEPRDLQVADAGAGAGPTLNYTGRQNAEASMLVCGVGGKARVKNSTSKNVTIYSVTEGNEFKLELQPGAIGEWTPRATGPVEVWASGVAEPVAGVFVAPSQWVAVARGGSARFLRLPAGRYEVGCWHPRLPGTHASVSLREGEAAAAKLVVGVDALGN